MSIRDEAERAAESEWPHWPNGSVPWSRDREDRHEFAREVYEDAYIAGATREPTEAEVEAAARAAALVDDYDGCFERLDAWAAAAEGQRESGDVEEPMDGDEEDARFWRDRVRAALEAARKAVER